MSLELTVLYRGAIDKTLDRKIQKAVGKKAAGAGYWAQKMARYLGFSFKNKAAANAAEKHVAGLAESGLTTLVRDDG